jgi:sugar phosphate permease
MMLVCLTGLFTSGVVARYTRRRRPLALAASAITLVAAGLLLAGTILGLPRGFFFGCFIFLGVGYSFGVVYGTAAKELNPREAAGTSIGLMNTGVYLTVATVTSAVGAILDAYSSSAARTASAIVYPREAYRAVFALCVVLALISCVCALRIRERKAAE